MPHVEHTMALAVGTRLGPYEVLASIGRGGRGEVYLARDATLNREVALKVLPEAFAHDPDRLARFRREAQVLASLNHPNIATIYGLEESSGVPALVLELVDGPTLADRLRTGPVPLDEALPIARQMAEALEAAHEQRIVHRDLKPANVKLRPDGVVKVLDFGLAKAFDPATTSDVDASALPTITSPALTRMGVILGTAAYMSPEQARGHPADRRSDLWAFGCVLYEMLTGRRAFEGVEVADTLASVIKNDPDWRALPRDTPAPVQRLLRRCLVKDPKGRIADASTARLEMDEALAPAAGGETLDRVPPRPRLWQRAAIAWSVAAAVSLAALTIGLLVTLRRPSEDAPTIQTTVQAPDGTTIGAPSVLGQGLPLAVSPNGTHLVFVATGSDDRPRLWLRSLDRNSAQPIAGSEDAVRPFWSPDSRSVAFFSLTDSSLKRVDLGSDRFLTVCELPQQLRNGGAGTWSADDVILFSPSLGGTAIPIYRVSASGGTPTPVTTVDAAAGQIRHVAPVFLPDGRHFLYTSVPMAGPPSVYVGSVGGSRPARLLQDAANTQYAAGRLLFLRGSTLFAQRFDAERLVLAEEAVPIVDGIAIEPFSRTGAFSASATGVLAYQPAARGLSQLAWFDRSGNRTGVLGEPADYNTVNLSPDGRRAAISVRDARGNMDIWLVDVARGVRTRFTVDPTENSQGVWSPDGTRLAFDAARMADRNSLSMKAADGRAAEDAIEKSPIAKFATSWSPDGRFLLSNSAAATPNTGNDLWVLPLFGDRKPYPFLQTPFAETRAQVAPDGRWLAYQSNESGRFEVYVAQFPGSGGKWQVSAGGGGSPRWRRDGRELFYVAEDGKLMTAGVDGRGSTFEVGAARALFAPRIRDQFYGIAYDVSADGQRFLVNTPVESRAASSIALVVNWPGLLRR